MKCLVVSLALKSQDKQMPNPSTEGTSSSKPLAASHVKR
ncbi:hypothetical protein BSF40_18150 [Pseudomonas sp. ACN5]|nr:hypothetical protein BSF40_18150 [Pseudomonas sp. ACN5]VVQ23500.1 hypothetical protein PS934_05511 [Pseudomonas fluorescens]